ncbi:MAG: hypothetical protein E7559_02395 [Ruminococcaceae bacterium]|nr:hypothetical protein [Oscillospiraceae bacterium]
MTAIGLKRMLKKTPASGTLFIIYFIIAAIAEPIGLIFLPDWENATQTDWIFHIATFASLFFVTVYTIIRLIRKAHKVRKNGEKTLRYLESNGLLEAAVAEYNHPGKAVFHANDRDRSFDKFAFRDNTLTENFIFALSSNQIIRYQDVEEACLVYYRLATGSYDNVVFTIFTKDGDEVDLFSSQYRLMAEPLYDLIEWICSVIKSKNPDCEVSDDIEIYRRGGLRDKRR